MRKKKLSRHWQDLTRKTSPRRVERSSRLPFQIVRKEHLRQKMTRLHDVTFAFHNYRIKLSQWCKSTMRDSRNTARLSRWKTAAAMTLLRLKTRVNPFACNFRASQPPSRTRRYQQTGEPLCSLQSPATVTSTSPASTSRSRAYRCTCSAVAHAPPDAAEASGCARTRVAEKKSDLDTGICPHQTIAIHDITGD